MNHILKNKFEFYVRNLVLLSNSSLNSIFLISFIIFIAPFTMGDIFPWVSAYYYQITWITIFILFLFNYRKILFHQRRLKNNFTLPVLLFSISFILSMVLGQDYADLTEFTKYNSTFSGVLKDVLIFVPMQILLVYLIYLSIDTIQELNKLIFSILRSGYIVNFIALSIFIIYSGSSGRGPEGRLGATFTDPNYLGRFEIFLIVISICSILFLKEQKINKFYFLNIFLCLFILYLTFSRSAIVTLMIIVAILMLTLKKKIIKYGVILVVILISVYLFTLVGAKRTSDDVIGNQSSSPSVPVDYSGTTRLALNYAAFMMFIDFPVFGVGYHNFYNVYINKDYLPIDIPLVSGISVVHSWLFSLIAEQGIFGLFPFLWLVFMINRNLIKKYRLTEIPAYKFAGITLFSLFFVIIFNGLFFPTFFTELIFSIILGLIGAYFKVYEYNNQYS